MSGCNSYLTGHGIIFQHLERLNHMINKINTAKRKDLTHHYTFSIDTINPHERDDAYSIEIMSGAHFIFWIHIVDLAHSVKPNTKHDIIARKLKERQFGPNNETTGLYTQEIIYSTSLEADKLRKCISFRIEYQDGSLSEPEVFLTQIINRRLLSFEQADKKLTVDDEHLPYALLRLYLIAKSLVKQKEVINQKLSLKAKQIVNILNTYINQQIDAHIKRICSKKSIKHYKRSYQIVKFKITSPLRRYNDIISQRIVKRI